MVESRLWHELWICGANRGYPSDSFRRRRGRVHLQRQYDLATVAASRFFVRVFDVYKKCVFCNSLTQLQMLESAGWHDAV